MNGEGFHEQVNAYLLGELSPERAADFERVLAADGALRTLLREREEDLERLTLEITPQAEPSADVRDRLLAAAATDARAASGNVPGPARVRASAPSADWSVFLRWALGATALASLALCAGLWARWEAARQESDALRTQIRALAADNDALRRARDDAAALRAAREQLEREVAAEREQAASIGREAGALREQLARTGLDLLAARKEDVFTRLQVGALQPLPGAAPPASAPGAGGVALWDPRRQQGMLVVENLPVPRTDQDYQVWVADPTRPQPVPSGVFHPVRAGEQQTLRFVTNERVERAVQFMVTLERKGGVNRITGPAVLESLPPR